MQFVDYIVPFMTSYFLSDWCQYWFYPMFAVAFVATCPVLFRKLIRG